jgi:predicted outer membrane repeat protein
MKAGKFTNRHRVSFLFFSLLFGIQLGNARTNDDTLVLNSDAHIVAWSGVADSAAVGNIYYTSLDSGIAALANNGILYLCGDTIKTFAEIIIDKNIILQGKTGTLLFADSTMERHRFFTVNEDKMLYINNVTMTGGYAEEGGAIYNDGIIYIENVLFTLNGAQNGGVIYNDATCHIINTTIVKNSTEIGGIITNYGYCYMVNTICAGNDNDMAGNINSIYYFNCLYAETPAFLFANWDDENNLSGYAPQAIFADYDNGDYTLRLTSPAINRGNTAKFLSYTENASYAGVVDLAGRKRLIGTDIDIGCYEAPIEAWRQPSDFLGNVYYWTLADGLRGVEAYGQGVTDILYLINDTINVPYELILSNDSAYNEYRTDLTLQGSGGTILMGSDTNRLIVNIGKTLIINNVAITGGYAVQGGALFNSGNTTLINSTLAGNRAELSGGAIYNTDTLIIIDATFADNHVLNSGHGGAISNEGGLFLSLNSIITGNTAQTGADIYTQNGEIKLAYSLYGDLYNEYGTTAIIDTGSIDTVSPAQLYVTGLLSSQGVVEIRQDSILNCTTAGVLCGYDSLRNWYYSYDGISWTDFWIRDTIQHNPIVISKDYLSTFRPVNWVSYGAWQYEYKVVAWRGAEPITREANLYYVTLEEGIEAVETAGRGLSDILFLIGEPFIRQEAIILDTGHYNTDLHLHGRMGTLFQRDYNFTCRFFEIDSNYHLRIDTVFLVGGSAPNGGAIYNKGTCTLYRDTLIHNTAGQLGGGAIYNSGNMSIFSGNLENNSALGAGGAIYNSGTLLINSNSFSNNQSDSSGGAIYAINTLSFSFNTFSYNSAGKDGGAVFFQSENSNLTTHNIDFEYNSAQNCGGALYVACSLPQFGTLNVRDNQAGEDGGGIYMHQYPHQPYSEIVFDCLQLKNNEAARYGGGMMLINSSPKLINGLLTKNRAAKGGALYNRLSNPLLINVTVGGNIVTENGGAIYNDSTSSPQLYNTIVWDNYADNLANSIENSSINCNPSYSFCLIQNLFPAGVGNYDGTLEANNPLFRNSATGDYHILPNSPAYDGGSNALWLSATGMSLSLFYVRDLDFSRRLFKDSIDLGCYEMGRIVAWRGTADSAAAGNIFYYTIYEGVAAVAAGGQGLSDTLFLMGDRIEMDGFALLNTSLFLQGKRNTALSSYLVGAISGFFGINSGFSLYMDSIIMEQSGPYSLVNAGKLHVSRCTFRNNSYTILSHGDSTFITHCSFINNGFLSGNICHNSGYMAIDSSLFLSNNANDYFAISGRGGVMEINGGTVLVKHSLFQNNSAIYGGTICQTAGNTKISHCRFTQNNATNGGAINTLNNSNTIVENCIFTQNNATNGGAINTLDNSNTVVENCTFTQNNATNGGVIYTLNNSNTVIENCTFTQNSATTGGALAHTGGQCVAVNSIFVGNSATTGLDIYNAQALFMAYSLYGTLYQDSTAIFVTDTNNRNNLTAFQVFGSDYPTLTAENIIPVVDDFHHFATGGALCGHDANQDWYCSRDNVRWLKITNRGNDTLPATVIRHDQLYNPRYIPRITFGAWQHHNYRVPIVAWRGTADIADTSNLCYQTVVEGVTAVSNAGIGLVDTLFVIDTTIAIAQEIRLGPSDYNTDLTLQGQPNTVFISDTTSNQYHRFFYNESKTLAIDKIKMQNGRALYGGAIHNNEGILQLSNMEFITNEAIEFGGAIFNEAGTLTATHILFSGNVANKGGAIYNKHTTSAISLVVNSLFADNTALTEGGAIYFNNDNGQAFTLLNCTFAGENNSPDAQILYYEKTGNSIAPKFINCIIDSVTNGHWFGSASSNESNVIFQHTLTRFASLGNHVNNQGNLLKTDPLFIDPEQGDYRLQLCSRAIDHAVLTTYLSLLNSVTWPNLGIDTSDLDGLPRLIAGQIDAGCYEYQTPVEHLAVQMPPDITIQYGDSIALFQLFGVAPYSVTYEDETGVSYMLYLSEPIYTLTPSRGDTTYHFINVVVMDARGCILPLAGDTTITVNTSPLIVDFLAADKVYDGTTAATVTQTFLIGVINNDVVSVAGGTAVFNNKNVGQNKTVTFSAYTLTGANAGNYHLSNFTAIDSADITARDLSIDFIANDKVYDGNRTAIISNILYINKISDDNVTVIGGSALFNNKNAGIDKPVTFSGYGLTGSDAANYHLFNTSALDSADITPKSLTIEIVANDKVYDGNNSATLADTLFVGMVPNDDLRVGGGTATFDDAFIGVDKPVTLTGFILIGVDAGNYTLTNTTAIDYADITQKELVINIVAYDKIYDGNTNATLASVTLQGVVGSEEVIISGGSAHFDTRNAGYNKLVTFTDYTLIGEEVAHYLPPSLPITTQADIYKKTLNIKPDEGQEKAVGAADPVFTYTSSGWIAGEGESLLTGQLSREAGEDIGQYKILRGSLEETSENYGIEFKHNVIFTIRGTQTITFIAPDTLVIPFDSPYQLTASASSGLPVIYSVSNENLAMVTGNLLYLSKGGEIDVSANVAPNPLYYAAGTVKQHIVIVLDFNTYVVTRQHNFFILNLKKLQEEEYEYGDCRWYENERLLHSGYSYSKGNQRSDLLLNGARYRFELETAQGLLTSTEYLYIDSLPPLPLKVYPNPVQNGEQLMVDVGEMADNQYSGKYIAIYNAMGQYLGKQPLNGRLTSFVLHLSAGVYFLRVEDKTAKIVIHK